MKNTNHYPIHALINSSIEYHNSASVSSVTGHWSRRKFVIKKIENHDESLGLITAYVSDLDDQGKNKYRNLYLDRITIVGPNPEERKFEELCV